MRLAGGVADAAPPDAAKIGEDGEFAVELDVFSGPFSVLLSLIARKRLDVTEVALAEVTDEFIAFVRSRPELDLSRVSEFLVVAAPAGARVIVTESAPARIPLTALAMRFSLVCV